MSYIYKIINDVNNKVYVGKTHGSLEKRWTDHLRQAKIPTEQHRPLYSAMNTYGIEKFHIILIEETEYPEEREQYWIWQLHSYTHDPLGGGYNATLGGDGRPWAFSTPTDIELLLQYAKEGLSAYRIGELMHHDPKTVRSKLEELGVPYQHNVHPSDNGSNRIVQQLNPQTHEVLNEFTSTREAARFLGDVRKNAHIAEAARGERHTAYKFIWRYK